MLVDFDVRRQQGMDFFTGESIIMNYGSDGLQLQCLTNMQLFISQDIKRWTGVLWITWVIVMFWTFILTAPIHCRGSSGDKKQTHLRMASEKMYWLSLFWTIPLNNQHKACVTFLNFNVYLDNFFFSSFMMQQFQN